MTLLCTVALVRELQRSFMPDINTNAPVIAHRSKKLRVSRRRGFEIPEASGYRRPGIMELKGGAPPIHPDEEGLRAD
jgi:hypothetical protein